MTKQPAIPDLRDAMTKMPGIAALAASVQALIAVTLITRRFGTLARLGGIRDLVLLLIFAGPVACIASAVIGSLGAYSYRLLPRSSFLLAGLKIWAGSSLGVVIFLPLALMTLAGRDGRRWVIWKSHIIVRSFSAS